MGTLILRKMGLDVQSDETMKIFCEIIEKRSKKLKYSRESIAKQSLKVYTELAAEKAKRKAKHS